MDSNTVYTFVRHLSPDFINYLSPCKVGVIMGSRSDWPYMKPCVDMLEKLKILSELGVISAHRTSERMRLYAQAAQSRGLQVIIACAGGSAHLPGMVASETILPTLGVAPNRDDHRAVGSMIAMPAGKPLAYMGGGSGPGNNAGAVNAALMAANILALADNDLGERLKKYHEELRDSVPFTCFDNP